MLKVQGKPLATVLFSVFPQAAQPLRRMAPHLTKKELDEIMQKGKKLKSKTLKTPAEKLCKINKARRKAGIPVIQLQAVHRALKGTTHRRGLKETRGRKKILSVANLKTIDKVRKKIIKRVDGDRAVTWSELIAKARVVKVDPSTVAKNRCWDGSLRKAPT